MANGLERREFLKVIGATGAGAALTGCGTGGAERLIPYVVAPEEVVPGMSTWYRTTCRECPAGCGMNVRTREGRAIKAEGNPLSPIAHGHLCARGQASLHGLYNPDRVPQALARTAEGGWDKLSWDDAEQRLARVLAQRQGESWFLTHSFTGSLDRLIDEFCAAFGIRRLRYEPFAYEPLRAASRMLFGRDAVPVHSFENAEVVLTFGADIFETWVSPVDYQHGWGQGVSYRNGRRGRLISVTPHQSLTDMNADEWLPVKPGTEHLVALAMARIIADGGGDAGAGAGMLATVDVTQAASAAGVSPERIRQVATAFANNGRSVAVGPGVASTHAAATAVASAVMLLNQVAGNIGRTVHIDRAEAAGQGTGSYADVQALVQRMDAGQVGTLLVHGPNPLYELPNRADVERALTRVPLVASFSSYLDETSAHAHLLLPDHHFLESWGDYQPRTGITAIVQPVMMPVFDTKQTGDVLLSVAVRAGAQLPDAAPTFYDYVRTQWQRGPYAAAGAGAAFDEWWRDVLQTGFVVQATPAAAPAAGAADAAALAQLPFSEPEISGPEDGYYLVVYPSYRFYDGRHANRPWLQELPDPVSKFCWSSWVEVNPALAEELDLDTGHIVEVATDFGSVEAPVWIHPGMRRDTIAIQLGQGHTQLGRYAMDRGVNPVTLLAPLADPVSGAFLYMQQRATLRPTGRWERPIQAGLNADQENREIAQHISLADAIAKDTERGLLVALGATGSGDEHLSEVQEGHGPAEEGGHGHEVHPFEARVHELQASGGFAPAEMDASPQGWPPEGTHYGEYSEEHPRWGMSIDMERCTGCSACITACYAENNIGIVGPQQVAKGRILHWLRIERYFEGEGEELHTAFLPMLCQQCGNAPCEPVCPVYAAYHTPDGLNGQIYNRCVGTRYCANNCPYKVRTYNWFSWEWPEPLNWQLNPDVTVREKGTMEKCTFCVQRIRDQQNQARIQGRAVMDGEIVPACAQTCPSEAIVFGNLKDPNARVTRVAASGRGYRVLEHINTQSAITYLKRVRPEGAEA